MTNVPVIVSHTGVKGICPGNRNINDDHIIKISKRKGLIGVGYFKLAICGTTPKDIVKTMNYIKKTSWKC